MSTVRAPRVEPGRARTGAVRPQLRVVAEPQERQHPSPAKLGTVVGVVVFTVLFALAGLHTLLVNGQAGIDDLNGRISEQESRQRDLSLTLATLQSPARVNDVARTRLGMIQPAATAFLTAAPDDDVRAMFDGTGDPSGNSVETPSGVAPVGTSNSTVGSQTSGVGSQTSGVGSQTSGVGSQTSGAGGR